MTEQRSELAEQAFTCTWAVFDKILPQMSADDCGSYLASLTPKAPGNPKRFKQIVSRYFNKVYKDDMAYFDERLEKLEGDVSDNLDSLTPEQVTEMINRVVKGERQLFKGTKKERNFLRELYRKRVKDSQQSILKAQFNQLFGEDKDEQQETA